MSAAGWLEMRDPECTCESDYCWDLSVVTPLIRLTRALCELKFRMKRLNCYAVCACFPNYQFYACWVSAFLICACWVSAVKFKLWSSAVKSLDAYRSTAEIHNSEMLGRGLCGPLFPITNTSYVSRQLVRKSNHLRVVHTWQQIPDLGPG